MCIVKPCICIQDKKPDFKTPVVIPITIKGMVHIHRFLNCTPCVLKIVLLLLSAGATVLEI